MASKSTSGAAKRKIKKQREESVKRMPKTDTYFKQNHEETEEQDIDNPGILLNKIKTASNSVSEPTATSSIDTINTKNVEPNIFNSLICERFPTDKVHFKEPLSYQEKRFIISQGPCQPKGPFPTDNRISSSWVTGNNDWRHLTQNIKRHDNSNDPIQCCIIFEQWRLNKTISEEMELSIQNECNFWRQVLDRVINVTLTLATSNLSFRGHRETDLSKNKGNFLSIITLISKYDPILENLLSMPGGKGTANYLSNTIQNEIITLLANTILEQIILSINRSPFFSVIMDTTQDISKIDQLSQVIRYVSVISDSDGNPKTLQINESFIGFVEIVDQSSAGLEESIINCITKNNLNLSKLRGQGYDGAANMSGVYSGVQARLKSKQKLATYIHCASHNLNLVLNDAINSSTEVKTFFGLVEKMYTFFSNSIKRWQLLLSSESSDISITLKRLCTTRWSSRYDSLLAVRHRYVDILKCLSQIILRSKNKDEIFEANYLKVHMEDFQFIFSVIFIGKILETVNVVSKALQSPKQELSTAVSLLNSALIKLQEYRSQYSDFFEIAVEIAKKWGVPQKFQEKRT
ncbi:zinc finger MYM-type protein 1-like [Sipha flava]|uniref:Zinc finger MYM-type protein 1-like n=1 Tax=Sipha flava TaxID=143950 RepID=A0A8B8GFI6_9HEMI|nr:zinc finger MYM-type protein 1-like [Sipha flava]